MIGHRFVIYCDTADDEELARLTFTAGPLAGAPVVRLPPRVLAPPGLRPFVEWERADWLVTRDEELVAVVEISRHGYTGDNGFQRFARIQRAASLGVPALYFTPFARTRLNELDLGQPNMRNVAPEMFQAIISTGEESGVPCLALRWPTDDTGTPFPLTLPVVQPTLATLRNLVEGFATSVRTGNTADWAWVPQDVRAAMAVQAAIPFRGGETRLTINLPIDVEGDVWIRAAMPDQYFATGKADKILAYVALGLRTHRPLPAGAGHGFWERPGRESVLYLGYQWRPDPSSGLIAFAGVQARRAGIPLIVVWPRVFLDNGAERGLLMDALAEFRRDGRGLIKTAGDRLGISLEALDRFRQRISLDGTQFGVFTLRSKVGRILAENADLCVFADGLHLPR